MDSTDVVLLHKGNHRLAQGLRLADPLACGRQARRLAKGEQAQGESSPMGRSAMLNNAKPVCFVLTADLAKALSFLIRNLQKG